MFSSSMNVGLRWNRQRCSENEEIFFCFHNCHDKYFPCIFTRDFVNIKISND